MLNPSPEALAHEFWAGTGLHGTFPRQIEQAIALKLPLALVKLRRLDVQAVKRWLEQRNVAAPLPADLRDLRGALVAYRGHGIVFVCGADQPEEQRLTIGHEVAHFLLDYHLPRQQVIQALGTGIADVLDGIRGPTPVERTGAILSHIRLAAHVHLLPRPGSDEEADAVVASAEERADRLALELVAPQESLDAFLQELSSHQVVSSQEIRAALTTHFGLPAHSCKDLLRYAVQRRPPSFVADISERMRRRREG